MQSVFMENIFIKEIVINGSLRRTIGMLAFLILVSFGAYIYIPLLFTPVPVTLQTFFVILAGAMLRKKDSILSQCLYVAFGMFGWPVFSQITGGWMKLAGPTGGYIVGFIFGAAIIAWLIEVFTANNKLNFNTIAFSMLCGILVIYLFGATWLGFVLRLSVAHAVKLGVAPFILPDFLKIVLAAIIYKSMNEKQRIIFK
ncbi:MAG: biotin transporter BioY [Candidatus Omnitrophica bacterium]|nr:biotin transporter BioY [Candidatus Omnitrophota bacterium]